MSLSADTRIRPSEVNTSDVVHLVCSCQFDGAEPIIPMTTMCGWTLRDDSRQVWHVRKPCSMCVEELFCPVCGGA